MEIYMVNNELHEINTCEVCGNQVLTSVLNLGPNPMCDDLVPVGDSRICREYPIEILFCENCFTAHQRFQVPKKDLFPDSYHYRSRFTADVLNGMVELVTSCETKFGDLTDKKILDIGCNDGSQLRHYKNFELDTYGIDPAENLAQKSMFRGHKMNPALLLLFSHPSLRFAQLLRQI